MLALAVNRYSRWLTTMHYQEKQLLPFFFFSTTPENEVPFRPPPPPIKVEITDSAGRGVFATRRIVAGDLIHTAKPLLTHPSLSSITTVCYLCLKNLSGSAESQDQSMRFCSGECKESSKEFYAVENRADWSVFNEYCRSQGLKYPLLVKRLACMVISQITSADVLDILQPASLSSEMIIKMEGEYSLLRSAFTKANITQEDISFLTKQWYTAVLARIRINAFRIELAGGLYEDLFSSAAALIEAEAAVGNAIYMLPSFYNHDCDPNAHIIWIDNTDARLKVLRDVDEGEELRICYIDASMNRNARKTVLLNGFGFKCNCPRCLSDD